MRLHLRARGRAAPALAWERYADPQRWATWSPQIAGVRTDGPRIAAGTTGVVVGHGGLRVAFAVEDVDEGSRTWTWRVEPTRAAGAALPGPLRRLGRMRLEHAVLDASGGCATTLAVTGAAPVVLAYAPLARLALGRLVRP